MTGSRFSLDKIGAGLPVAQAQEELERAVQTGAVVVTAPPGSGKTTFVPALVANAVAGRGGSATAGSTAPARPLRTLLVQPRRVAVRAAARRLASLAGQPLGEHVGFTVRGERKIGRETLIEALTPGVLLRRLLADPELEGVGAVVLDEVHERSLDGDLLLALVAEVRELRDDLVVVAMSATLDAQATADLLGATTVDVPAALHPLEIAYRPAHGARLDERGVTRDFLAHVARLALEEQRQAGCDALVFLPGAREVDEVVAQARSLAQAAAHNVEVLPLHGRLPSKDQDRAVSGRQAGDPPRIVVSTALAESSLTVPGVRLVVDAGLSREVRRDRGRDMAGLVTVSASRASAEQRAGRAAREGAGRSVRAYSETEFARMPQAVTPEILSADLTDASLLLAAWGTPGGEGLRLPNAPPKLAVAQASKTLGALGLVDDAGRITKLGSRIAGMPVGVREARALITGAAELGSAQLAAEVVAAVSDDFRAQDGDAARLLTDLRTGRAAGADRWRRETKRLAQLVADSTTSPAAAPHASAAEATGRVLALARPEWIARRTGANSRSYLLASGTRAALPENSPLQACEWIAVREVQRAEGRAADGTGAVIRLAAAIDEATAFEVAAPLRVSDRVAVIDGGKVRVREESKLGAITLASTPTAATKEDTGPAFAAHLREVGLAALDWSGAAGELRARLGLLQRELGDPWPAVDDATLTETLADWLGDDLARLKPGSQLSSLDLTSALRRLLPWPEAAKLDELVPERLAVPSGSTARIDYSHASEEGGRPVVAVKLQELFGLSESPRLVRGRVPVLFHLLSPARKPLAVTADLASFWNGPYQDVRKEMRGKYPRHPWPEDPWTAVATAKTNRALARE